MSLSVVSVFDLTPPEKLQLVEELWDDLAAKAGSEQGNRTVHTVELKR